MKGLFQCPPWARGFCPFGAYSLKAQSGSGLFLQFLDFFQRKLGGCCYLLIRKAH